MKRPKVGDRIIHDEPEFERTTQGVVMDILSSQFTYQTDNGLEKHSLLSQNQDPLVN